MAVGHNDTTRAPAELSWRKSSYSGQSTNGSAECVEVAPLPSSGYAVRDSKVGDVGGILRTSPEAWTALTAWVKIGQH